MLRAHPHADRRRRRTSTAGCCASSTPAISSRTLSIRWLRAAGFDLRTHKQRRRAVRLLGRRRTLPRAHRRRDRRRARRRRRLAGPVRAQGAQRQVLDTTSSSAACKRRSRSITRRSRSTWPTWSSSATLFTALNKDTQALHHELVAFDPPQAQALSDKAVDIIRAAEAGELPPRIAADRRLLSLPLSCAYPSAAGRRGMTHHAIARQATHDHHARPIPARRHRQRSRTGSRPHQQQQVFRVFGYAGSESTIAKHAIEALGLAPTSRDGRRPATCSMRAFTGKAALVMTRKGTPASTIHSLIYRVSEATPAGDREAQERSRRDPRASSPVARAGGAPVRRNRGSARSSCGSTDIHKPRFVLNAKSLLRDAKLIVLDEVSMVGAGDGARSARLRQADPGAGRSRPAAADQGRRRLHDADKPDVMLTEIHRQAGESAIIRLATMARRGQADSLRRARRFRLEDAPDRRRRPSSCCAAAR